MKLIIGNDHGGYLCKCELVKHILILGGIEITDIGTDSEEIVRYPYYAAKVAKAVASGEADRGILICSTGIGMSIVANRYAGVRATLCTNAIMAKACREHNDSNLLCLGGKITSIQEAVNFLDIWLNTDYIKGRHAISLGLIMDIDNGKGIADIKSTLTY